ncbi:Putative secreted protein [Corynebacterium glyciniphilum AJ 3170]|uniref:Putative secreted protein n=1 Tax=Corynebacterium glyciniphilum AJ 3170 TaxID=1404245 RepID=X5DQG5_9CORY|nr:hypothetical protein [Corynebacterium glyciniphilum]AHW62902.1 Putative secreted protein [Corynebacterium glyciniphilum AJ 3170]
MTRSRRILASASLAAAVLVAGAVVPPIGSAAEPRTVTGTGTVGAIDAADTLAAGGTGTSYFSGDLVAELGYRPGTQDGHATNPAGDCSSPVPLPESFEPACMTHDLGYDLLRVADRTGEAIPEHTRRDLDRQMAEQMRDSCAEGGPGTAGCRAMARVAHAAVAANTLRQHNGAPVEEWFPW